MGRQFLGVAVVAVVMPAVFRLLVASRLVLSAVLWHGLIFRCFAGQPVFFFRRWHAGAFV